MGKLSCFEILLVEPLGVYHAGQTLTGKVKVALRESMKMKALHLWICGRARVGETGKRGGKGKTKKDKGAEEVYIDHKMCLFGDGESAQMHPEGECWYDFSLPLPDSLPSSMEAKLGYVRYFCQAVIDRPWKFNHETKKVFTVLSTMDLNKESKEFKNADEGLAHTSVRCCCCVRGECSALFRINKRAFVPGEAIVIYAEVKNQSNADIQGSRACIKQYIDFYGVPSGLSKKKKAEPRRVSCIVASKEHGRIPAGQTDVWNNERIVVPSLPPSRLVGCTLINISYAIKFDVRVRHGKDLKVTTDFLVGTVPLRNLYPVLPPAEAANLPLPAVTLPARLQPPCYRESVTGHVSTADEGDSKYMRGEKEFVPLYIYYDWGQTAHTTQYPCDLKS